MPFACEPKNAHIRSSFGFTLLILETQCNKTEKEKRVKMFAFRYVWACRLEFYGVKFNSRFHFVFHWLTCTSPVNIAKVGIGFYSTNDGDFKSIERNANLFSPPPPRLLYCAISFILFVSF